MVTFFYRHAEVQRRKQREHVSLNEGYQQFEERHEDGKQHRQHRRAVAHRHVHLAEEEDEAEKADDDDVPCGDVGEQTNHQHERLDENAQQFDERHQRQRELEPPRHARRIDDMHPVRFRGTEGGDEEGEQRQHHRDGDVAGYVGAEREERNQPHQVVDQDEEKERQQVGHEAVVLVADGWSGDVVAHEENHRLHPRLQSGGRHAAPPPVGFRYREEDPQQRRHADEDGKNVLCDGQVERRTVAGRLLHDFSLLRMVGRSDDEPVVAMLAVMKLRRHERVKPRRPAVEDNRQRHGHVMPVEREHMPRVVVADMVEDKGAGVEGTVAAGAGLRRPCRSRQEGNQQNWGQYFSMHHA